jgi:hypothetical protein
MKEEINNAAEELCALWRKDEDAIADEEFDGFHFRYKIKCKYFEMNTVVDYPSGQKRTNVYVDPNYIDFNKYKYEYISKHKEWSWRKFRFIIVEETHQSNLLYTKELIETLYYKINFCKNNKTTLFPLPYLIEKQKKEITVFEMPIYNSLIEKEGEEFYLSDNDFDNLLSEIQLKWFRIPSMSEKDIMAIKLPGTNKIAKRITTKE